MKSVCPGKRSPYSLSRQDKGFTLVEMMVVLAIVAILVGFGYTGFTGTLERQRCQAALKRITWVLKQAQLQAIEKHANCAVVVNAGTDTIQVFLNSNPEATTVDAGDTLLENINIAQEFQGVDVRTNNAFHFNSRGFLRATLGQTISLAPSNDATDLGNVTIVRVGRINVEMPEGWKH